MFTTILIYAIAFFALFQPNAQRLYAAMVFVTFMMLHEWAFQQYEGLAYYGTAALFDFTIIALTSGIRPLPKMVIALHWICLASIVTNAVGWVMWMLYMPPDLYNLAFIGMYLVTLAIMTKRSGDDGRGFSVDRWRSCFRFSYAARLGYRRIREKIL